MSKTQSKFKQKQDDVVKEMAERVLEALEKGDKVWNRPWDISKCTTGLAHNVVSKKPYRGVNQFYLSIVSSDFEFATYKQWKELGNKHAIANGEYELAETADGKPYKKPNAYYGVKKGESAHTVIYFTIITKEDKDTGDETRIPILKYFKVFGRSQTNIPAPEIEPPSEDDMPTISDREQEIIDTMKQWMDDEGISFAEGGDRAYYRYSSDHIQMPDLIAFPSGLAYLPTLFHESVHSTGHAKRLSRKMGSYFGSDDYAFEELVAEMGASLLCRHYNVLPTDPLEDGLENQIAYLANWCKRIKSNPRLLIQAGSKAQRAVDYILDTKFDEEDKEDESVSD